MICVNMKKHMLDVYVVMFKIKHKAEYQCKMFFISMHVGWMAQGEFHKHRLLALQPCWHLIRKTDYSKEVKSA